MTESNERLLREELEQFGEILRDHRPLASPVELDRMKMRAMTQASQIAPARTKGTFMKSRVASLLIAATLVFGGTGVVLAGTGGLPGSGGSSSSAPNNQYCPPSSNAPGKPKGQDGGNKCGQPNPGKPGDSGKKNGKR